MGDSRTHSEADKCPRQEGRATDTIVIAPTSSTQTVPLRFPPARLAKTPLFGTVFSQQRQAGPTADTTCVHTPVHGPHANKRACVLRNADKEAWVKL